ncbi:lipopolysaccharide assembly protein LapB [Planomicrobium sp. CPCC 101079]|uniref:tetratricopeptide repeat protein n=1 Tax=Planomicrobium sp. CPCC 101079 TaxID=2599618 RepID=UPI0011B3A588|nr:tetratricopeptide repeat protein [Planomicrobium sp. CPCC 101079]TWT00094.1 tetratricopeptide repeat protein [Planomicrobium sp. CPCC 101079]
MENKKKKNKENVLSFIPTGEYYYKKALKELQRDQFPKAHKYLQRATELSPKDPLILMHYGIVLMEMQEFERAMDALREAHSIDPEETDILFFLAEVHAHMGMFLEARKYAKKYIEQDIQGDYAAEAMEIIDFAEQEDWQLFDDEGEAQDSEYFYQQEKARRWMEQGNFAGAIHLLEQLIEEKPDFWGAHNNLALAYFYVGEAEMAKTLLHDVLRRNPGNLHALCNLAVFHYYEKNDELEDVLDLLKKIQPYVFEHRYKLGATFALVGKYKEAYRWLRSLQKRGFDGDPAFYFWLSHAAYHSGHEDVARQAWKQLAKMDPDKEGYEPWAENAVMPHADALEHDRDYLVEKLDHPHKSERLFGLFLLGKSSHKQEIISHPKWLEADQPSLLETFLLGYALGHPFKEAVPEEQAFLRAMKATEILYDKEGMVTQQGSYAFQMWFMIFDKAFDRKYQFKNPNALAAAADYMFNSSRDQSVTKKAIAETYGISPATLTKYVNDLIQYLPIFES